MKQIILYLVLVVLCISPPKIASAQFFQSALTIPVNPTIYDSIGIVDYYFTPDDGMTMFSQNYSRVGAIITLINCYIVPASFTYAYKYDTTWIGHLPVGTYLCTFYSRKDARTSVNDPYVPCDSMPNRDTLYYTFTVSAYGVGINDINLSTFIISPNPATTTLYSSTSLHDRDLTITDITGRLCLAPYTDREIDISALPAGVYSLRLQGRDGSVVRRFVRE